MRNNLHRKLSNKQDNTSHATHPHVDIPRPSVGERVRFKVTDVAFGGEGVGRVDGFVVFVPFVIDGEEVEVQITEVKKKFARARLLSVIAPSEDRVEPRCRYFGECGGCQYQHMDYEAQLKLKHRQVEDLFERIGRFDRSRVAPLVPCPQPYHYRNRILIRSQWNGRERRLHVGFRRHNHHWVVEVEECRIAEPALNEQLLEIHKNPPSKGGLKVTLRIAPEDWILPDHSFFQNNFFLLKNLVNTVREAFQSSGSGCLVDAYCGVGFFAIELADLTQRYAGVEYDHRSILAARENAKKNGRENGWFEEGKTEELLPKLLSRFDASKTSVILDPPRRGCHPVAISQLRRLRPLQIIYVSCHPATLARDLNALCDGNVYSLERVIPLDMFPQTQHVECVADLRLGELNLAEESQTGKQPCQAR